MEHFMRRNFNHKFIYGGNEFENKSQNPLITRAMISRKLLFNRITADKRK